MILSDLKLVAGIHGITDCSHLKKNNILALMEQHDSCDTCKLYVSIFVPDMREMLCTKKQQVVPPKSMALKVDRTAHFPPEPASKNLIEKITAGYCNRIAPDGFQEAACAVCGQLKLLSISIPLNTTSYDLKVLNVSGVTRKEGKALLV